MYHLYHTESIVIGSSPSQEGSRYLSLLTEDLGLIQALAQGLREEKSKLRYTLQPYSYSTVSLVQGRIWRVVSSQEKENIFHNFGPQSKEIILCGRIFSLLKKLVAGEEKNTSLFAVMKNGIEFLKDGLTEEEIKALEYLLVLRVLRNLGHLPSSTSLDELSAGTNISREFLSRVLSFQKEAVDSINLALMESQLISQSFPVI
ncbi:MAG: DNA repair protein RecO [Patescibacteria group bacterium]